MIGAPHGGLLGQIVSSGAGWMTAAADCWRFEPDAGYQEKTNSLTHKSKGEEVARGAIIKAVNDSIGLCWYEGWGVSGVINKEAKAISAVTGCDMTGEELRRAGERILNLERCFNVRNGLTPKDNYNVSRRVVEEPADGPGKGKAIRWYPRGIINEYYSFLGSDDKSRKPWRSTLKRRGWRYH